MHIPYSTIRLWMRPGRTSRPYIFITGAPRSGTTLVKSILCAHPEIGGGDYESTGIFKPRDLSRFCSGEVPRSEVDRLVQSSSTLAEFYDRFTDATMAFHGRSGRFVDKVWPGFGRFRWVPLIAPNAYWIHVIRDGRDAFCSARNHPNVPQGRSAKLYAEYWTRCIKEASILPSKRTTTIRYEDLCDDPEQVIKHLMERIEMEFHPMQRDPYVRSRGTMKTRSVHTRLAENITPATVERWRTELSPEDQAVFESIASSTLSKYYTLR